MSDPTRNDKGEFVDDDQALANLCLMLGRLTEQLAIEVAAIHEAAYRRAEATYVNGLVGQARSVQQYALSVNRWKGAKSTSGSTIEESEHSE